MSSIAIITLEHETCCNCGIVFGIESKHFARLQRTGDAFYCPNGHRQYYAETTEKRLKRELEQMKQRLEREARYAQSMADQRNHAIRRLSATKGVVTRQKKKLARVFKGVCPCCNRHFENLQRHMETKHPGMAC